MDFDQAILAHSKWKTRLKNYIQGHEYVDPNILGKDDQCELGKWLHGEGKKLSGLSGFADLTAKHAKFHVAAAAVARGARQCSPEKALELLDPLKSEFGRASSDCVNALTVLRSAVPK